MRDHYYSSSTILSASLKDSLGEVDSQLEADQALVKTFGW